VESAAPHFQDASDAEGKPAWVFSSDLTAGAFGGTVIALVLDGAESAFAGAWYMNGRVHGNSRYHSPSGGGSLKVRFCWVDGEAVFGRYARDCVQEHIFHGRHVEREREVVGVTCVNKKIA